MSSYLMRGDVLKPQKPNGFSRERSNLQEWSDIASEHSQTATRAKDGAVKLPSTGGQPKLRSTSSPPRGFDGSDPYKRAKEDLNYKGSGGNYMPGVRRGSR
ncbi:MULTISPECIES: hypothetical protein [unclassified Bradyrhizobium]|uniref:hypothetical protein n=1 Tax=unclassified Bradyrhizobium TaxID=2631580 RepID=UPI0028ECD24F|nr:MULTISPECIES: hypothetical protein [unclassified Bradyrhizobium]